MQSYKIYHAYNLTIQSEIPLSLPEAVSTDRPDIVVRLGTPPVPSRLKRTYDGVGYAFGNNSLLVQWNTVGSFYIENGDKILFHPAEDLVSASLPEVPLLGTVMAVAMFQRGVTTLHGSSVAMDNKAVIFLGNKGKGKSTLAAYCLRQGHQLISDDICAIEYPDKDGKPSIYPSFASIKLWPDALEHLKLSEQHHEQIHPSLEKRKLAIPKDFADSAMEIGAVVLLENGDSLQLERLAGHAAVSHLLPHMLINRFPEDQPSQERRSVFLQVARLLQTVPVYTLHRPKNLSVLPETLALIQNTLL